ncbi:hypothetical protein N7510_011861, partial [Penicillium lagena]|uniref:uncharacterized protein n=1 Tax=Penicillium lagena TaxID=94218 RepID=UPI00254018F6
MPTKPTLIFVHEAWHTSECWAHGYECIAPQLDYSGTATPLESNASSIIQIQNLIIAATTSGQNMVLVNHSFGGVVGCSSVKGFTQKEPSRLRFGSGEVIGLIQLAAFLLPLNCSLYDIIGSASREPCHHHGPEGWEITDNGDPQLLFYNDLMPVDRVFWASKLKDSHLRHFLIERIPTQVGQMCQFGISIAQMMLPFQFKCKNHLCLKQKKRVQLWLQDTLNQKLNGFYS